MIFNDIEIKAFKKPHTLKKVDYQKIVEELFNTPISDNKEMMVIILEN